MQKHSGTYFFILELLGLLFQLGHLLFQDVVGARLRVESSYLTLELVDDQVLLRALLSRLMEILKGGYWLGDRVHWRRTGLVG